MPRQKADTLKTLRQRQRETGRTLALDGAAWRKLRAYVLRYQPICEQCGKLATDVDHIDNDPTNNDTTNLQSLCHACHSRKTQADMGKKVTFGCDALGMPLDPDHHWNRREVPALLRSGKSPATDDHKPTIPLHAQGRERIEP